MKSVVNFLLFLFIWGSSFGQATMSTSGNWATASNWTGNNIGNIVTESVSVSNNVNPTVFNGSNYTVGGTTLNNNNTLTINSGGTLTIGDNSHASNLTTNNNAVISVAGTFVIWGNLVVNNNIVWNITGTVIVKGNVQLSNNANLNVTGGTLQVGGNFTSGTNTNISIPSGGVTIAGTVSVGNGSNLSGCAGCFNVGGSCSGPVSFCSNSTLPVTVVDFAGKTEATAVRLSWTTMSEINFDKFIIESSSDAQDFKAIGLVPGHGNSNTRIEYSFTDQTPFNGRNYYRLKAVDYDGSFEFTATIRVIADAIERISISPNPVNNGIITIQSNFTFSEDDLISIYNNVGLLVAETHCSATNGFNWESNLPPGVFILQLRRGGRMMMVRFVVHY